MTPEQTAVVQEGFQKVTTIAGQAAEIFYHNLFELDPRLQGLFHGDMTEQGRKLMHIIGVAVHGLKSPEALIPAVQEMGRRHVQYGVEAKDYETVGTALMLPLDQGLGADFTPQVREAWSATYAFAIRGHETGGICQTIGGLAEVYGSPVVPHVQQAKRSYLIESARLSRHRTQAYTSLLAREGEVTVALLYDMLTDHELRQCCFCPRRPPAHPHLAVRPQRLRQFAPCVLGSGGLTV